MVSAKFTVTPNTGYIYATDFLITDTTTTDSKIVSRVWDLGDGNFSYNDTSITKTYSYPGTYNIYLTATDLEGNVSTETKQIQIDYYIRDSIEVVDIPGEYANPSDFTESPFKLKVTTSQIEQTPVLNLFAAGSPSTPYETVPEHWNFLTPTWYFTDKYFNHTNSLSVETEPIYLNDKVVALSGYAEFYYVDGLSPGPFDLNCPVIITAMLETSGISFPGDSNIYQYPSHSNNKFTLAALPWRVNSLRPNKLKITENYISDIFPQKWKDIKVPFIVTCHHKLKSNQDSNILFSYPYSNFYGDISSVDITLSGTDGFIIDEAPLHFQRTDKQGSQTGGVIFTTLTPTSATDTTVIQASTVAHFKPRGDVVDPNEFVYPGDYGVNRNVWISNPEQNTLNRIFIDVYPADCDILNYYKDNGLLFDGMIKTYDVPKVTSLDTYNYAMSGFSGIYAMAVDPEDSTVVAADAELDCLYRISTTGTILSTYPLSSLGDYIPYQKLFHTWTWTAAPKSQNATYFTFYSPALISTNPNNYILLVGGAHQPNSIISIDPIRHALQLKIEPYDLPPQNAKITLIEIFDPQLPADHATSLMTWTTASSFATNVYPLTGSPSLSADPNYYIVSVDGALQSPDSYTIDNINKTIILSEVPPSPPTNTTVSVIYMPSIYPPAHWSLAKEDNTSGVGSFSFRGFHPNFRNDNAASFIVNVGGVFQSPNSYNVDYTNRVINFSQPVLSGIPISVTQISVSGDVSLTPAYTPSYISIDEDKNFWVSMFNTATVVKFDPNFNVIATAVPDSVDWPQRQFTVSPPIRHEASLFGDTITPLTTADYYVNEFFLKPPTVETDRDSNIWVTYAHPLTSKLIKYNPSGSPIYDISLPYNSVPVGLAINKQNNVWVSNSFNTTTSGGSLELYSTTGTLMSSITGFTHPGYLAVDKKNNLWFTHGVRSIGYLNTQENILSSWYLNPYNDDFIGQPLSAFFANEALSAYPIYEDEEIGGLAVDVYNRVWVVDSLYNTTYMFPASATAVISNLRRIKIKPNSIVGYFLDLDPENNNKTIIEIGEEGIYKSAQATGDWTGNKWHQKYTSSETLTAVLTGVSSPFSIKEFTNTSQIYRKNEDFNLAGYLKSLALPENLYSNTNFFDTLLGAVVGNNTLSGSEDIGQRIYERIANFHENTADIDTCNVNQIISHAETFGVPFYNYNAIFPTEMQKYLDIASVAKQRLWGIKTPVPDFNKSIGPELNTETALVTAGTKIYTRSKFTGKYTLYTIPLTSTETTTQDVYPLSSLEGLGFVQPFLTNYLFYEQVPVYSNTFVEGLIDWSNTNTTLSPTLSTTAEWLDNEGIVENIFNYLLTRDLFAK